MHPYSASFFFSFLTTAQLSIVQLLVIHTWEQPSNDLALPKIRTLGAPLMVLLQLHWHVPPKTCLNSFDANLVKKPPWELTKVLNFVYNIVWLSPNFKVRILTNLFLERFG